MMIDVSIATVYSEVNFDYFLSFFRFPPFVCKKKIVFYFCVLVLINYGFNYIFGDVIVSCMTGGLGFKMAASNSKWRASEVIVTTRHN